MARVLWRGCHGTGRAGAAVCYVRQSNRRSSAEEGGEGGQGTVDHVSATLGGAPEMSSQPIIIEMQTPSAPPPPASRTSRPPPPEEDGSWIVGPSPPLRADNTDHSEAMPSVSSDLGEMRVSSSTTTTTTTCGGSGTHPQTLLDIVACWYFYEHCYDCALARRTSH